LNTLYEVIGKFWGNEQSFDQEELRQKKKADDSFLEEGPYFGTQISWVI